MNKKISILLVIVLIILCVCALAACNKTNNVSINHGYYFYSTSNNPADNAKVNPAVWVHLNPDYTWNASDNTGGVYEIKGSTVTLRKNTLATYMICNYENGIMTIYSTDGSTDGVYLVQNEVAEKKNSSESSNFDLISTPEEFLTIDANASNATLSYALANDIDFTDFTFTTSADPDTGEEITTILRTEIAPLFGDKNYSFSGILEGNGHKIKGLSIVTDTSTSAKGLFAKTDGAIIRNLVLEDVELCQEGGEAILPAGVLVGQATDTTISHVSVYGSVNYISYGTVSDDANIVGGICGEAINSKMTYCSFTTTATGGSNNTTGQMRIYNTRSYNLYVGGICGNAKGECLFDQCYLNGNVSVEHEAFDKSNSDTQVNQASSIFGGILGAHDGDGNLTVINCFVEVTRISHKFKSDSNSNIHNRINTNICVGGVVGYAMGPQTIDIAIHNCALVGALNEDAELNRGSLLVNVGGICGQVNTDLMYSYRDGSISVIAKTNSPFTDDKIEVNIAGLSTNAGLDGCFVTGGLITARMEITKDSKVPRNAGKLNIVILTLSDEIKNSLYDESYLDTEERKVAAYYYYKEEMVGFSGQQYVEIRNTAIDSNTLQTYANSQLKSYNISNLNDKTATAVLKTLYLIGFKQYKNVVDITKNPENAWNIVAGLLPRLYWI